MAKLKNSKRKNVSKQTKSVKKKETVPLPSLKKKEEAFKVFARLVKNARSFKEAYRAIKKTFGCPHSSWGKVRDVTRILTGHATFVDAYEAKGQPAKIPYTEIRKQRKKSKAVKKEIIDGPEVPRLSSARTADGWKTRMLDVGYTVFISPDKKEYVRAEDNHPADLVITAPEREGLPALRLRLFQGSEAERAKEQRSEAKKVAARKAAAKKKARIKKDAAMKRTKTYKRSMAHKRTRRKKKSTKARK